ncbi:MAG TPA: hypothetical protein ENI73_05545, partial [Spirochaetes bacterium]|nr:hypothetical protein [Spirochaetota bacterium]
MNLMLGLKRFRGGGVHPPENKDLSNHNRIINADLPKVVKIPLQQHAGAAAKCIVETGTEVKEGDLIGEAVGAFSANVHASIQGKVIDIVKESTVTGFESEMVVIEFEGTFQGQI